MRHKKIKGFSILAVLLFIVGIVVAISVWALSGQNNTSQNDGNVDTLAASIINDGLKYKAVMQQYSIGQSKKFAENLNFLPNVSSPLNMLDPTNGASWDRVNSKALVTGAEFPKGYWAYNKRLFHAPALGTVSPDNTFLVSGISDAVCKRINEKLHGVSNIPVTNVATSDSTIDITMTNANTFNNFQMHSSLDAYMWANGCLNRANVPTDNFYYQVGQIN
jgi:hypothetical protein